MTYRSFDSARAASGTRDAASETHDKEERT
jgi:hypothetical protein